MIIIKCKEENHNFVVKKSGKHHLNQVTKLNSTGNGTNRYHEPPPETPEKIWCPLGHS